MALRILIAPDKFKYTLDAPDVCRAIEEGLLVRFPNARITSIPLADGGEGTADILTHFTHGAEVPLSASDPLNRQVQTHYGISQDGHTAYIETASASGIGLLSEAERSPLMTSSFGTGEIIRHALQQGVKKLVIGVGGTATNDGGIGIATALGYDFYDASGQLLVPCGQNLVKVHSIGTEGVLDELKDVEVTVLCDVQNPLTGPTGAAFTYAVQKGAVDNELEFLDKGLTNLASIIRNDLHIDIEQMKGAGAGGGIAGGLVAFLGGDLKKGIAEVMETAELEQHVIESDVVITGEGKVDQQTLMGKVVAGVATHCRTHAKPLFAVAGTNLLGEATVASLGLESIVALTDVVPIEKAMKSPYPLLRDLASSSLADQIASTL